MAEILTVVVTYNGMPWIERCLKSVHDSTMASDLLVVDNGSTDGTAEWIREHFPETSLIENSGNLGFAAANNVGFRYAMARDYKYVYLLNQDAWVYPETFGTLARVFGQPGNRYGVLSPMQMTAALTEMDPQFRKHCGKQVARTSEETVPVPFVMAAHWMVSRECLADTGFFSPAFHHYGEDNDFSNRARYHGYSIGIVRTASAVHDRLNRPRPKDYRMKLKVINAKASVADPGKSPFTSLLGQTLLLALMGVRHLSPALLKGIGELWSTYPDLKAFRESAKKKGAFMD